MNFVISKSNFALLIVGAKFLCSSELLVQLWCGFDTAFVSVLPDSYYHKKYIEMFQFFLKSTNGVPELLMCLIHLHSFSTKGRCWI